MNSVRKQTAEKAADPNARSKLITYTVILLVISSRIHETESGLAACRTCFEWALPFCKWAIKPGDICDNYASVVAVVVAVVAAVVVAASLRLSTCCWRWCMCYSVWRVYSHLLGAYCLIKMRTEVEAETKIF